VTRGYDRTGVAPAIDRRTRFWRWGQRHPRPTPSQAALAELAAPVLSLISSNVSADGSAGVSDGGSCHAAASDSGPTWTTSETNLRRHSVRLMKRRERHSLRRCCERQRKGNSD